MFTQGICDDGASILYDGVPVPVERIISLLNNPVESGAEVHVLASISKRLMAENSALEDCLRGFVFACGGEGPDHEIEVFPNFVMKAKRVLANMKRGE